MSGGFLVEVDASGTPVSVEYGTDAVIPAELLAIAGKLVSAGTYDVRFLWVEDHPNRPCVVQVSPIPAVDAARSTVYLRGEWADRLPFGLTLRELDVLTLMVLGLSSAAIADQLTLAIRTVTTHVDRVMRKLGVFSRTAAATIAMDEGILRVPFPGNGDASEQLRLGRILRDTAIPRDTGPRVVRKPLTIGAALPLIGPAAADGIEMARASRLAVDELNARGGIDGRQIALEIVDVDIFDAASVRTAMERLAAQEVDVITSGYLAHQDVAHEFVADSGIPYLHAATLDVMAQRVRNDPSRYGGIFQVCASDSNYAPRFVQMMSQLRDRGQWHPSSRRLTILQAAWDQTDLGLAEAAALADRNGWDIEILQPHSDGNASWARLADDIGVTEPAAIMIGNYMVDETVAFLERFLMRPSHSLIYSLYAPSVPQFREMLGARADGVIWATVTGTYSDPRARAFATRYREQFGVNPGRSHAGIAYDRVRLMAHAWAFADNPRDPKRVTEELRQLVYRGVNGVYHFSDPTQTALTYPGRTADPSLAQAHLVFQIQGGKQRIIDPSPYADAEFVPPSWLPSRTPTPVT